MKGGLQATFTGFTFIAVLLFLTQSGFSRFWKKSRYFVLLIGLTFGFHIVFNAELLGGTGIMLSGVPLQKAFFFSGRVALLISAGTYFTMTVEPEKLAEALREMIAPLGKFGMPVDKLSLLFLLTLSFVPIISEQATRIREAQMARGISMGKNMLSRVGKTLPVVIPLFTLSLSRAERLALVLESRGYNSPIKRTSMKKLKFSGNDYALTVVAVALIISVFI